MYILKLKFPGLTLIKTEVKPGMDGYQDKILQHQTLPIPVLDVEKLHADDLDLLYAHIFYLTVL